MPKIKRILPTFAILGVAAFGIFAAIVALHLHNCYRNTVYSERFSETKFSQIAIDMPQSAVLESLGAPLATETNRGFAAWMLLNYTNEHYSDAHSNAAVAALWFSKPKAKSHTFHACIVHVGEDGKVVGKTSFIRK